MGVWGVEKKKKTARDRDRDRDRDQVLLRLLEEGATVTMTVTSVFFEKP